MPGYKTVTNVDALTSHLRRLICPYCKSLLREAVQTEAGIRLCESCYRHISQKRTSGESNQLIAPDCKVYTDRAVRRETAEVEVYCDHGCPWTGKAKDLQSHFKSECPNVPELCPNKGCQESLPVHQLSDHAQKHCQYRRVSCDWCHRKTTLNLLDHHMHHCPEFASEHRQNLDVLQNHVEEYGPPAHAQLSLPLSVTLCTDPVHPAMEQGMVNLYRPTTEELTLQTEHQKMYSLLNPQGQPTTLVISSCRLLHSQNSDTLRRRLLHQQETLGNLPPSPPNLQFELPFPIQEQGMGQPTAHDQLVTGFQHIHPENAEALRRRKLHQQESSTTRLQGVNRTDTCYSETHIMELETRVEELFRQQAALKTHIAKLEMQLQASLASTHNGSFLWKIPDVARRKQDAIDEKTTFIYSPPFYTSHNGYKMCFKAYLNGDGNGYTTHLSLFIVIMKGEHDTLLRWPFRQRVSLTLLDQIHKNHITQRFNPDPESSSFQQPSSDMNVASGFPRFVLNSIFTNKDYVCDDVMYIKCTVDTAHIYQTY